MANVTKKLSASLNEAQLETFEQMEKAAHWADSAEIIIRKDGENLMFEADWLLPVLNQRTGQ